VCVYVCVCVCTYAQLTYQPGLAESVQCACVCVCVCMYVFMCVKIPQIDQLIIALNKFKVSKALKCIHVSMYVNIAQTDLRILTASTRNPKLF